ncbi:ribosome assembly protein METTL17, mitochondrial [Narcine bancroftii]|uniref:ribosome assembly protein METTL17, mitochondrial n=1 Tax=Narcine bancroftii TaxID=1343680 RepID=UPI00383125BF
MAALGPRVTTRGLMGLCWRRRPARGSMPAAGTARPRSSPARELPHRRHPGISSLKTLHLPEELRQAALLLLQENPINCLEDNVRNLNNFLWSRKRAVEDSEVRAQARKLVEKFREEADSKEQAPAEPGTHRSGEDEEGSLRVRVLSELRKTLPHWKPVR